MYFECACVCVRACVLECVRVCECVCVYVSMCVHAFMRTSNRSALQTKCWVLIIDVFTYLLIYWFLDWARCRDGGDVWVCEWMCFDERLHLKAWRLECGACTSSLLATFHHSMQVNGMCVWWLCWLCADCVLACRAASPVATWQALWTLMETNTP
jgi:hypothetical protein